MQVFETILQGGVNRLRKNCPGVCIAWIRKIVVAKIKYTLVRGFHARTCTPLFLRQFHSYDRSNWTWRQTLCSGAEGATSENSQTSSASPTLRLTKIYSTQMQLQLSQIQNGECQRGTGLCFSNPNLFKIRESSCFKIQILFKSTKVLSLRGIASVNATHCHILRSASRTEFSKLSPGPTTVKKYSNVKSK